MPNTETEEINQNAKHDAESGEYEKHFKIRDGSLVVDLGAHVGHFSELVCNKGGVVLAFEPHPKNFHWLNERLKGKRALAINKAASNRFGVAALFECPLNSGANSLFKHDGCSDVSYEVGCVDIGAVLKAWRIRPDFIKVDTEGAEWDILESLLRNGIRTNMAIETHDHSLYRRCRALAEANRMNWLPTTSHVGICYCIPR